MQVFTLIWEPHNVTNKDDIESLVYMLIHLARGRLPWLFVDVRHGDNYINIFNCKRTINAKELVGSLPSGFVALVDYARSMEATDIPDYEYLRQILLEMLKNDTRGGPIDKSGVNKFQWSSPTKNKRGYFIKAKSTQPKDRNVN